MILLSLASSIVVAALYVLVKYLVTGKLPSLEVVIVLAVVPPLISYLLTNKKTKQ